MATLSSWSYHQILDIGLNFTSSTSTHQIHNGVLVNSQATPHRSSIHEYNGVYDVPHIPVKASHGPITASISIQKLTNG